jgi:ABC-type sugar transport systems, permease components
MSAKSVEAAEAEAAGTDDAVSPRAPRGPKSSIWARFDHAVVPYILISPFFILFVAFGIFPIVYSALISFQSYRYEYPRGRDGTSMNLFTKRWVGFENFERTLTSWDFWQALINTFGLFVLSAVPQLVLALILASLLNRRLRAQSLFRVGILVPYITPIVASSIVFSAFFARDGGQANWILSLFGVENTYGNRVIEGLDWRQERWSAWLALIIMIDWKWTGYNALLYLAAMQSIPKDVYEAAALDGAGAWRQLWSITVPMIRPMVIFTVVLSTIGSLQLFAEPVQFDDNPASGSGGGNRHLWRTVAQLIWHTGWNQQNFGWAGAMSWVLFVVVVVVAAFNGWLSNKIGGRK